MKVFITGYLGYVGNPLTKILLDQGFEVTGCDTCYYPQDGFGNSKTYAASAQVNHLNKDVRDLTEVDLIGHEALIHLAALSNDPLGELNLFWTNDINNLASIRLAKLAKQAGISKFVFSSSCSVYGANGHHLVDEMAPVNPLSAYARSKVEAEQQILALQDESFCPTVMRSATAYGLSPCMRLDLVANNLTASAYATGKVKILTDGTPWRPLIHVEDMVRAFVAVLKAPIEKIRGETFNVGSNCDNYTVRDIADIVETIVPNSKIEYANKVDNDPRSYKVNFTKIHEKLGFSPQRKLQEALEEIYDVLRSMSFTENDFNDKRFYRVRFLRWLIDECRVDKNLRRLDLVG